MDAVLDGVDQQVDVLAELGALVRRQKRRIDYLGRRERELGMPIPQQSAELRQFGALLMRVFEMQLAIGIVEAAHGREHGASR